MKVKKILIVDDDKDLLLALRVRLKSRGYETAFATDAHSALQMTAEEKPDLILLDLGLPDDNGFIMMEKLKQADDLASIPVIVVSARPVDVYKDAAILGGAKAYFQKPFDNQDLLSVIQKELGGPLGNVEEVPG